MQIPHASYLWLVCSTVPTLFLCVQDLGNFSRLSNKSFVVEKGIVFPDAVSFYTAACYTIHTPAVQAM